MPVSGWLLAIIKKGENMYGGELCGTVTPPSADCESSILFAWISKAKEVGLLAPRLAACNIVGRTAGVEPITFGSVQHCQSK